MQAFHLSCRFLAHIYLASRHEHLPACPERGMADGAVLEDSHVPPRLHIYPGNGQNSAGVLLTAVIYYREKPAQGQAQRKPGARLQGSFPRGVTEDRHNMREVLSTQEALRGAGDQSLCLPLPGTSPNPRPPEGEQVFSTSCGVAWFKHSEPFLSINGGNPSKI